MNCHKGLVILVVFCLLAPHISWAQAAPAGSDLCFEGYVSYTPFKFRSAALDDLIYTGGIEYDRNNLGTHLSTLGHFLNYPGKLVHARMDYAADVLPLVLLREPALADKWGNPLTTARKTLPGIGISPLGLRFLWRGDKAIKQFWNAKLGGLVFTEKALSPEATYANFSIQSSAGAQIRLTPRTDLRLAYQFFHFSNLYVNGTNPGLDTLGANFGIVYHLRAGSKW